MCAKEKNTTMTSKLLECLFDKKGGCWVRSIVEKPTIDDQLVILVVAKWSVESAVLVALNNGDSFFYRAN